MCLCILCVQLTFGPKLDGSQSEPEVMNVWHKAQYFLCDPVACKNRMKTRMNTQIKSKPQIKSLVLCCTVSAGIV